MYNEGGTPSVEGSLFHGNWGFDGGGVYNLNAATTIRDCTFSQNRAHNSGGGLYNDGGDLALANCVLWGDTPNEIWQLFEIAVVTYSDIQGGYAGIGNINADPLFVNAGGWDFRLSPGSPCIDAGDNTAVPVGVTTDFDGNPRFLNDPATPDTGVPGNGYPNAVVDMGAYEAAPPACPADTNNDGILDNGDIGAFISFFLSGNLGGDFTGDGILDNGDIGAFIAAFLAGC